MWYVLFLFCVKILENKIKLRYIDAELNVCPGRKKGKMEVIIEEIIAKFKKSE